MTDVHTCEESSACEACDDQRQAAAFAMGYLSNTLAGALGEKEWALALPKIHTLCRFIESAALPTPAPTMVDGQYPPLPYTDYRLYEAGARDGYGDAYDADQMRAYVDADRATRPTLQSLGGDAGVSEEENDATWPQWAEDILSFIRSESGYDGYDDMTEGVGLPAEVKEHVSELNCVIDRLTNEVASLRASIPTIEKSDVGANEPSLKERCEALMQAGHDFWKACRREAGGGAVRWVKATDGTTIIFTRGEYAQTLLGAIGSDYQAPEVVFEQPGDDDGMGGVIAQQAAALSLTSTEKSDGWRLFGYRYVVNGVHVVFHEGETPPPSDGYDSGSLVALYANQVAQNKPFLDYDELLVAFTSKWSGAQKVEAGDVLEWIMSRPVVMGALPAAPKAAEKSGRSE